MGDEDINKLIKMIKNQAAKFGFETLLWTTTRIQILCKKKTGISVSRMTMWRYLKHIGHSCKKVQKIYQEANRLAQKRWVAESINEIKNTVKEHNAILYF